MRCNVIYASLLVLGTGLLAGCGQKGPLFLPPPKPVTPAPAPAASAHAPAPVTTVVSPSVSHGG